MNKYIKLIQWKIRFQEELKKNYPEIRERKELFFLVAMHILKFNRTNIIIALIKNKELKLIYRKKFEYLLNELKNYKPIQYLLGETFFYNMYLKIDKNVFIPRVETEELVNWIILEISSISNPYILDIGTGSGCIALTLKKQIPKSKIYAIDCFSKAIECAKKNSYLHNLHINFIKIDILKKFPKNLPLFDIIVSNPPYVRFFEKKLMSQSTLKFEPKNSIFVPKKNPLIFYEKIAKWSFNNLISGGKIYFEINQYLSKEIFKLLKKIKYKNIKIKKDMQGTKRMIRAFVDNF